MCGSVLDGLCVFVQASFKSLVLGFCEPMKIIELASFTNGTMNLPKEMERSPCRSKGR